MKADPVPLRIVRGGSHVGTIARTASGVPVDMTGCSAELAVRTSASDPWIVLASTAQPETLYLGPSYIWNVLVPATATAGLTAGKYIGYFRVQYSAIRVEYPVRFRVTVVEPGE